MSAANVQFTVFSKPWQEMSLPELGAHLKGLGFDGVELPIRPGFQVQPENVAEGLPEAARILADFGIRIGSVAAPTDEPTIAACGEAGVPIIRICPPIPKERAYPDAVADLQREWEALVPVLDAHGVAIGVQNHAGRSLPNALAIVHALGPFDVKHVSGVWDVAHEALAGTEPDMALDIVWDCMRLVNLKNAYWKRTNSPEAEYAEWTWYWTSGRQGRADWRIVVAELKRRGYEGDVCLTAEYSDHEAVDQLIAEDIQYARELFG